jgi:type VI protein secretion system component Hcp
MAERAHLFMKLTGSSSGWVKGEAQVVNFKDQIELTNWKWTLAGKRGSVGGEPSIFGFSKLMDRSTTAMLSAMRNGEPMTAVIAMEESSRDQFRLIVTLESVLITQYGFATQIGDTLGDIEEDWEFDYESVRFDYRPNAKEGMSMATLVRLPGASKLVPESVEDRMVSDGSELSTGQLNKVWDRISDKKTRPGPPTPEPKDKK